MSPAADAARYRRVDPLFIECAERRWLDATFGLWDHGDVSGSAAPVEWRFAVPPGAGNFTFTGLVVSDVGESAIFERDASTIAREAT